MWRKAGFMALWRVERRLEVLATISILLALAQSQPGIVWERSGLLGASPYMSSVAFSPDGQYLVAIGSHGYNTGRLWFWRVADGRLIHFPRWDDALPIAVSPNFQLVATVDRESYFVRVWRIADGQLVRTFSPQFNAQSAAFSPDGEYLAVSNYVSYYSQLLLWRVSDGRLVFSRSTGGVGVAFSPDGRYLATASGRVWRVPDGQLVRNLGVSGHSIAFSPNGEFLAIGSRSGILIWRVSDWRMVRIFEGSGVSIGFASLAFSPDGDHLLSALRFGLSGYSYYLIKLWRVSDGHLVYQREIPALAVAFSPSGHHFAMIRVHSSVSSADSVQLWRAIEGAFERAFSGHLGTIRALSASPDERYLASGGYDGRVYIWRIDGGLIERVIENWAPVGSLAYSPNGTYLAFGDVDGALRLWRTTDWQEVHTLWHPMPYVDWLTFTHDAQHVMTATRYPCYSYD